jgi:hypothetical protein
VQRAGLGVHSGVIRESRVALGGELLGGALDGGARAPVDDARDAAVRALEESEELRRAALALDDAVEEVRPVEARGSRSTISRRVGGSAVAVSARRGTAAKRSRSTPSSRYSGRKSCPHWATQCASSMAKSARRARSSWARNPSPTSRSGET